MKILITEYIFILFIWLSNSIPCKYRLKLKEKHRERILWSMISQTILFLKTEYLNTSNERPYLLVSVDSSSEFTNMEQRKEADGRTWAGVEDVELHASHQWSRGCDWESVGDPDREGWRGHGGLAGSSREQGLMRGWVRWSWVTGKGCGGRSAWWRLGGEEPPPGTQYTPFQTSTHQISPRSLTSSWTH